MSSSPKTHRARQALEHLQRRDPWMIEAAEIARAEGGERSPSIFAILEDYSEAVPLTDTLRPPGARQAFRERAGDAYTYGALCRNGLVFSAWRMTQGIYRFDPDLYPSLVETPIDGILPVELLDRLPEWCVYLETPGLTMPENAIGIGGAPVHGVWCLLSENAKRERYLVLALDLDDANPEVIYPVLDLLLSEDTLTDCLQRSDDRFNEQAVSLDASVKSTVSSGQTLRPVIEPVINLLLYLCTQQDISGPHGQPGNPQPVRTRRNGTRLFPAPGVRQWEVGVRMGGTLRAAQAALARQAEAGPGAHIAVRPHIRKAHWHGFRSGPMKTADGAPIPTHQRRFSLRWLPVIPVNVDNIDQLPAVIRAVE